MAKLLLLSLTTTMRRLLVSTSVLLQILCVVMSIPLAVLLLPTADAAQVMECCQDSDCRAEYCSKVDEETCQTKYPFYRMAAVADEGGGGGNNGGECIATGNSLNVACCLDYRCQQCNAINTIYNCQLTHPYFFTQFYIDTSPKCKSSFAAVRGNAIKSFNGEWFDYEGECDMVLLHVPQFEISANPLHSNPNSPLFIHIRTKLLDSKDKKSGHPMTDIASIAIQIGHDILQVAGWGVYALNGVVGAIWKEPKQKDRRDEANNIINNNPVPMADLMALDGFPLYHNRPSTKRDVFEVRIGRKENITITTYMDQILLRIDGGSEQHFKHAHGLMGNFGGTRVKRNLKPLETVDPFTWAQDWQVRPDKGDPMLFRTARAPQYPTPCRIKVATTTSQGKYLRPPPQQRRLLFWEEESAAAYDDDDDDDTETTITTTLEDAERACSHLLSGDQFEECVFDVLSGGPSYNIEDIHATGVY